MLLTNAELEKHLNRKPDNDIKMDNRDNVGVANERITKLSAPVNYAESSISDGGSIHGDTTDSEQEVEREKPKRRNAVSRHGPSLPRIAAQKIISESKLTANQQNKNDSNLKSSSGLSRSNSPEMTLDPKN